MTGEHQAQIIDFKEQAVKRRPSIERQLGEEATAKIIYLPFRQPSDPVESDKALYADIAIPQIDTDFELLLANSVSGIIDVMDNAGYSSEAAMLRQECVKARQRNISSERIHHLALEFIEAVDTTLSLKAHLAYQVAHAENSTREKYQ
jgi:hypothetical protein